VNHSMLEYSDLTWRHLPQPPRDDRSARTHLARSQQPATVRQQRAGGLTAGAVRPEYGEHQSS
jgi:hypothetical protein